MFEGTQHSQCLPLHEACVTVDVPLYVVTAIVRANPAAAQQAESSYGRLPLHCACRRSKADPAVVKLLLQHHDRACIEPDALGRLPLHYALSNGACGAVLHLLLTSHPEAARGVDQNGWTPLHVACQVGSSTGIVTVLLHEYPESCVLRTSRGSTPLQCLASNGNKHRDEVREMILEARRKVNASFVQLPKPLLLGNNKCTAVELV
jgi:ankyrin repeat protein